jgi:hypothetical protein
LHIQDVIDHTIQQKGAKEMSDVSSELGYS